MFSQMHKRRDAFTFSLGGLTTISGFTMAPAVASRPAKPSVGKPSGCADARGAADTGLRSDDQPHAA